MPSARLPAAVEVLQARSDVTRLAGAPRQPMRGPGGRGVEGVDVATAALLLAANSPGAFTGVRRTVGGLPASVSWPRLEEAPWWLAWLAANGFLGAVPVWVAVVAHDLGTGWCAASGARRQRPSAVDAPELATGPRTATWARGCGTA